MTALPYTPDDTAWARALLAYERMKRYARHYKRIAAMRPHWRHK